MDPTLASDLLVFPYSLPKSLPLITPPPQICSSYLSWKVFTIPSCHIPVAFQRSYDKNVLLHGRMRPLVVCPLPAMLALFRTVLALACPATLAFTQYVDCAMYFLPHLHLMFPLFGTLIPALLLHFDLVTSFFFFPDLSLVIASQGGLPLMPRLITFPFYPSPSTTASPFCCFFVDSLTSFSSH